MSEQLRDLSENNILKSDRIVVRKKKTVAKWAKKWELEDLPRLPIPELKATCDRYLEAVGPLLSPEELEETKRKTQEFLQFEGVNLHKQLLELKATASTSWLEGFWDTMYLEYRAPVPININPCFVLQDDPTPSRNNQIQRAATLINSTLAFVKLLRNNALAPDTERKTKLCMHQYTLLFGSTRIPGFGRDRLVTDYKSKTITVVCRDQYYSVNVYGSDGKPLPVDDLENIISSIDTESRRAERNSDGVMPPVGMLTTMERDEWAGCYARLMDAGPNNKAFLEKLSSGLLLLCLDQHMPQTTLEMSKILLHADGRNRWFDKSIQLIVCSNGKAGINMEHSPVDGHTTLRYAEDFFHYSVRTRCDSERSFSQLDSAEVMSGPNIKEHVTKLDFQLDSHLMSKINKATSEFQKFASSVHTSILHYTSYGKRFVVNNKVSPDALVQCAFQLTYYRFAGKLEGTYESAMTKRFFHGRTECMRPVTQKMVEMIQAFKTGSTLQQMKAVRMAAEEHVRKVRLAKSGEGVDRHLTGMLNLARENQRRLSGYEVPEIFKDLGWARLRYDMMSTSNCGGYALSSFGFGPVVPEGFGIGYIIKDNCMHFNVTSFIKGNETKYTSLLEQSLYDLGQLLVNGTPIRIAPRSKV